MTVKVENGKMEQVEIDSYVRYLKEKNCGREIRDLTLKICEDDYVEMIYTFEPIPFERIRRITGYLVGTTDRWNNAKAAEERDRLVHMDFCECI